ncbi:MAG: CoA pyrophosphatase [Roseateles asaccharophilus]|uniref:NUDIX domain-containing protein n=1 Tax=Roseateles asaccharophilus TaxID=582607 RepID=A0A4R6MVU2_9BURK|nr:CoA pyrophosphatase [Roseateles asaccharophilus]MDN3545957.1 CoA pyrophosphatase [Roseateles asaccharophilus]TDP06592.1 NUDIX domain-containing protein [Roseateles asaccharophilus]
MSRPPILNPQAVPVTGVDTHLPAVPAAVLSPAALRQRFAAQPAWQPEIAGDGARFAQREPAAAAVLVPLVMHESGLRLLLTRRTAHLRSHAGQISFPGGRVESEDGGVVETALRETAEEIGLHRTQIEVIGQLPIYTTVTAFEVTPVVALLRPGFTLTLDAGEVDEAFEVPLDFLMNPAHHQRHTFRWEGGERQFLSMPWHQRDAQGVLREYFIWGATAAMLRNLYRFLSA